MTPFHFAFKIEDIESTRKFYTQILGCKEGRSTQHWIDFDFFGHQLSAHVSKQIPELDYCGNVDGVNVPIPHFGCLINNEQFEAITDRLIKNDITFIVPPQTRYEGQPGEQKTLFVLDYSNNPIEFKSFKNEDEVFS